MKIYTYGRGPDFCTICEERYYLDYQTKHKYEHPALFGMVEQEFVAMGSPKLNEIASYFICNACREIVEDNMDNVIEFLKNKRNKTIVFK